MWRPVRPVPLSGFHSRRQICDDQAIFDDNKIEHVNGTGIEYESNASVSKMAFLMLRARAKEEHKQIKLTKIIITKRYEGRDKEYQAYMYVQFAYFLV